MRPDQRIVTQLPLTTLWDTSGEIQLDKKRDVGCEEVADLLRQGPVRFLLADCGHPLTWVPAEDGYRFWKEVVKTRLVEPGLANNEFRLEDFPGEYCFVGTEWGGRDQVPVVLLEMHH